MINASPTTTPGGPPFYSLMVGNPLFLDSTLARGDVELLSSPSSSR